jgi:hypothetical protein
MVLCREKEKENYCEQVTARLSVSLDCVVELPEGWEEVLCEK